MGIARSSLMARGALCPIPLYDRRNSASGETTPPAVAFPCSGWCTVPCGYGVADPTRGLAFAYPCIVSCPKDTSRLSGQGRARGGPRPVVLCPHRLARAGRCACPDAGRSATHCRFYPSSAFCHAQQPPDTRDQRPAPLALAPRLWATGPTGGVVQAQTMSSLARSRDLRRAAIVPRTARGAVSGEPTRLSLAPDHLGHDLTRCRALS